MAVRGEAGGGKRRAEPLPPAETVTVPLLRGKRHKLDDIIIRAVLGAARCFLNFSNFSQQPKFSEFCVRACVKNVGVQMPVSAPHRVLCGLKFKLLLGSIDKRDGVSEFAFGRFFSFN